MIKTIVILLTTTISVINVPSNSRQSTSNRNIRFEFTAARMPDYKDMIEIKAVLYNDNDTAVSFLSMSCDGDQYLLKYDTAKFMVYPFIACNSDHVLVQKIPARGKYEFKAHCQLKTKQLNIGLGVYLYQVDRKFDVKKFDRKMFYPLVYKEENVIDGGVKSL